MVLYTSRWHSLPATTPSLQHTFCRPPANVAQEREYCNSFCFQCRIVLALSIFFFTFWLSTDNIKSIIHISVPTLSLSSLFCMETRSPEVSAHASTLSLAELSQSWQSWYASWYCWWSLTATSNLSSMALDWPHSFVYLVLASSTNLFTLATGDCFERVLAFSVRLSSTCCRDMMSWCNTCMGVEKGNIKTMKNTSVNFLTPACYWATYHHICGKSQCLPLYLSAILYFSTFKP